MATKAFAVAALTFTYLACSTTIFVMSQETASGVGKTADINGMTMYYETFGEGESLLLLHGFSSSGQETWAAFVEPLSKKYRLIIPDLRGHGRTTNPDEAFTHKECASDMFALLDHLKVQRIKAAGISSGGMTLLHMATQQPERVTAMVLIGATHYFPESCREIQRGTTVEALFKEGDMWGGYEQMRKIHMHGDDQIRKLRRQFHAFKDSYDDMNLSKTELGTIRAKTLIIHGDRDEFFPVEIPVEMYRAIPNSSLWIVPNGGHVPIIAGRFPVVLAQNVPFVPTILDYFDSAIRPTPGRGPAGSDGIAGAELSMTHGRQAEFVVPPEVFVHHTPERAFIGPGTIQMASGNILMAAPWSRPAGDFDELAAKYPVPMLYRSSDGGRTWREEGRMRMEWNIPGMISDGGISFLRLRDGRLAFLGHRHVKTLHGGALPVISFSGDDGKTWTAARIIGDPEGIWYVMNDRLIQMQSGRLMVPVACAAPELDQKYYEGARTVGLCFFSNDGGESWKKSRVPASLDDERGMDEACVAELGDGKLVMLARTGSGSVYRSRSEDGGDTWSKPEPTTLTSACSSLTLKRLPDCRLIVFYNHAQPIKKGAFFPRTPLTYAVSGDGGQSWGPPILVDDDGMAEKNRQHIYPSICFTKEGMLVVYSTHVADPKGSFSRGGLEGWKIGGGKRCILAYPK